MSDTALNRYVMQGLSTARASYTPSPGTVASGQPLGIFWYETDTTKLYAWNSLINAWVLITGSGGGGGGGTQTEFGQQIFQAQSAATFTSGFFGLVPIVMPLTVTLNSVKFFTTTASASSVVQGAIYTANADGTVHNLAVSGTPVTGVAQGFNKINLGAGTTVNKDQLYWVGFLLSVASLSMCSVATNFPAVAFQSASTLPSTVTGASYGSGQDWGTMWASSDV